MADLRLGRLVFWKISRRRRGARCARTVRVGGALAAAAAALLALAPAHAPAARSENTQPPPSENPARLAQTRVFVPTGLTRILVPLVDGRELPPGSPPAVSGPTQTPIRAQLAWIGVQAGAAGGGGGGGARGKEGGEGQPEIGWIGPRAVWRSGGRPVDAAAGSWVLVLELPELQGPTTVRVWVPEWRLEETLALVPAVPGRAAGEALVRDVVNETVNLALAEGGSPAVAAGILSSATAWPAERWRVWPALAALQHRVGGGNAGVGVVRIGLVEDDLLGALGTQVEAQWHAALGGLAAADAAVARQVAWRLTAVANVGGVAAPVWPPDRAAQRQLLDDLLDPALPPPGRLARAEAFLASQPGALARVVSDAAEGGGDAGAQRSLVEVFNLGNAPMLAWVEPGERTPREDAPAADLTAVPALGSAILTAMPSGPTPSSAARLRVRIGGHESALALANWAVPVVPPGSPVGPLAADLDMASLQTGRSRPPAEAGPWTTAGRLLRSEEGWVLYLECGLEPAAEPATLERERLEIWFGPHDASAAVVRLDAAGRDADGGTARSRAVWDGERGVLFRWIRVPDGAVEPDGCVRFGVVRRDARGVRSAWPRPMLPWQAEPGRIAARTTAWDGGVASEEVEGAGAGALRP